jgi:hypothetical protein
MYIKVAICVFVVQMTTLSVNSCVDPNKPAVMQATKTLVTYYFLGGVDFSCVVCPDMAFMKLPNGWFAVPGNGVTLLLSSNLIIA